MRPCEIKIERRTLTNAEQLDLKTPRSVSIAVAAYSDQVADNTARQLIYTGSLLGKEVINELDDYINRICEKIDRINSERSDGNKVYVDAREVLEASKHLIRSPMDAACILEGKPIERNKDIKNNCGILKSN